MPISLQEYDAVQENSAFFRLPDAGYVRVGGPDRVDFIQRQTTNDLRLLSPGRALLNVLTTPTARILDVLIVVTEAKSLGLITLPGRGSETVRYLKSRIFFMDKVTLEDASSQVAQFNLEGKEAAAALTQMGLTKVPELDEVVDGTIGGIEARIIGQEGLIGLGFRVLVGADEAEALVAVFTSKGIPALSAEGYETLRIEAGLPSPPNELGGDYNPLEVNLERAISTRKGCYTGQEVIARQLNYDKVTQRLVGLRLAQPAQAGNQIQANGKGVGLLTSATESPRYGPIALAVIRRPHFEAGTELTIEGTSGQIKAIVTELPFRS